jgi:hypothetical protein
MVIRLLCAHQIPCYVMRNRKLITAFIKIRPEDFSFQIFYLMMGKNLKRDGYGYRPCVLALNLSDRFRTCSCKPPDF